MKNLPYCERLRQLNLPSLVYRRARGDMILLYKIMNGYIDTKCTQFITRNLRSKITESSVRGHQYHLFIRRPKGTTNILNKCFSIRTARMWNSLSEDIVTSSSINIFKNKLDDYWKDQDLKFDYRALYNYHRS